MNWFIQRICEPSTQAGFAVLAQVAKTFAPQYAFVFDALTILFGGAAAVIPEKSASVTSDR
jgi:hypothetical protein